MALRDRYSNRYSQSTEELLTQKTPVSNAIAATGTVVFSGTPVADETLTIGTDVYTFKSSRSLAFEVTINANNSTQGDNLDTAIAADATDYTSSNTTGTVTITAAVGGTAGNSIALAEAATGTAVSGAALTGGVDTSPGVLGEICSDDSYLYCYTSTGWRRVSLGSAY
jgi:phage tail sheath gpL-like